MDKDSSPGSLTACRCAPVSENVRGTSRSHSRRTVPALHEVERHAAAVVTSATRTMRKEAEAYGLTQAEFVAVRLLLPGKELTLTELARRLSRSVTTMSRVISNLEDKGLLYKRRTRDDRRLVFLKLTEEGVALGSSLQERAMSYEEMCVRGISDEDLLICYATLRKIAMNQVSWEKRSAELDFVHQSAEVM